METQTIKTEPEQKETTATPQRRERQLKMVNWTKIEQSINAINKGE